MEITLETFKKKARKDVLAAVSSDASVSYDDLYYAVKKNHEAFRKRGVRPGDRVAIVLPNSVEYLILLWSLWSYGAVTCPMSTRMPSDTVDKNIPYLGCCYLVNGKGWHRVEAFEGFDIPDDVISIIFTSGTSGFPKAAMHSYENMYYNALGSNENIKLDETSRWLLNLPLYHIGGLAIMLRCLLANAAVAVGNSICAVTHLSCVATQLRRLLNDPSINLKSLDALLLGGGPIPQGLVERAVEQEIALFTTYGLTEMSSQVTTTCPAASKETLMSSGKALRYSEIMIAEDMEIFVRGKPLFKGYYGLEAVHGWFHTGDVGSFDAGGYLHVIGRKDRMFISGGENIQPEEIETALCNLDGIENAVVLSVDDEEFGKRPIAFVEAPSYDEALWRCVLEEKLPRFKIPMAFYKVD